VAEHVREREGQAKTGVWALWACGNLGALGLVPSFFRSLGLKKKTYRLPSVRFTSRPPGYPPLPFFASPTHHLTTSPVRPPHPDLRRALLSAANKQPTTTAATTTSHHAPPLTLCCPFGALRRSWCAGHVRHPVPGFVHPQRTHVAATHAPGEITNSLGKRAGWSDPRANPCAALHARHLPLLPHVHPSSLSFFSFFLRFRSSGLKRQPGDRTGS
jgi:hypothetical protein